MAEKMRIVLRNYGKIDPLKIDITSMPAVIRPEESPRHGQRMSFKRSGFRLWTGGADGMK